MARRSVFPVTAANRSAPVSLPQSFLKQRKHVREARASTDYLKASRPSETPQWPPHTFPLLHKRDRGSDAQGMNSDLVRGFFYTARSLYRSALTGNRSSRGVRSQQTRVAPTPPSVLPQ